MTFEEFGLSENVMRGLDAMNFKEATPVQEQTIPVILQKRDLIACAQTGTGKTAAYILPLLNLLTEKQGDGDRVRAVIVAPTRELAQQIDMQFEGFSSYFYCCGFGWGRRRFMGPAKAGINDGCGHYYRHTGTAYLSFEYLEYRFFGSGVFYSR